MQWILHPMRFQALNATGAKLEDEGGDKKS